MKASKIGALVGILLIGVLVTISLRTSKFKHQQRIINQKETEIQTLAIHLEDEMTRYEELEDATEMLKDSISDTRLELEMLRSSIGDKSASIEKINEELDKLKSNRKKSSKPKSKPKPKTKPKPKPVVADNKKPSPPPANPIEKLENSRIVLSKDKPKPNKPAEKPSSQPSAPTYVPNPPMVPSSYNQPDPIITPARMPEARDILRNTGVVFQKVTGHKFKDGREISKMMRNTNGWQYTKMLFSLQHSNPNLLVGKEFMVKIFDLENNMILTYLEENPKFPNRNLKGITFTYEGKAVELTYCNTQRKKSENYEIQLFLIENGKEVPLEKGFYQIIKNGEFVK